jgi:hypothetical protein
MTTFAKCISTASLLAVLVLTGCGGGGNSGSKGGDLKTFTAGASKICKSQTAQLQALPSPKKTADLSPYLDKLSAFTHVSRDNLGKLDPPSDKKAAFDAYLAALDSQLAKFDKAKETAKSGDTAGAVAMLKAAEPSGRGVKAKAGALGLTDCAA